MSETDSTPPPHEFIPKNYGVSAWKPVVSSFYVRHMPDGVFLEMDGFALEAGFVKLTPNAARHVAWLITKAADAAEEKKGDKTCLILQ